MSDQQLRAVVTAVFVHAQLMMLFLWIMLADLSGDRGWRAMMAMAVVPVGVSMHLLLIGRKQ